MRTHPLHLYRLSLALLTAALLFLACRHYAVGRGLDTLRTERALDLAYIRALEEENGEANAMVADLQNERELLRTDIKERGGDPDRPALFLHDRLGGQYTGPSNLEAH